MEKKYLAQVETTLKKLSAHDAQQLSLKRLLVNYSDEFYFWLLTDGYKLSQVVKDILPAMPDAEIQENFTGRSGKAALTDAYNIYSFFKKTANRHGIAVTKCKNIMDFGCGWGRIIRFFLKDVEPEGLYGIDCYDDMINLCKQSNLRANFSTNATMPPTSFADNTFDLIYLYSVFSHLSEDAHLKWIAEFKRILRPGGILLATTRPRSFIEFCGELRRTTDNKAFASGAVASFTDTKQVLNDYDNGLFCHSATGGGGVLDTSFYGETCIPRKYVATTWTKYFSRIDFVPCEVHHCFDQDVVIGIK